MVFNTLWPSGVIWCVWSSSWSKLVQIMTCHLTTSSHNLNQCRSIISDIHLMAISKWIPQPLITQISWSCLKSLAIQLFVQHLVPAYKKKIIKALLIFLCVEFTGAFPTQRASNVESIFMSCCHNVIRKHPKLDGVRTEIIHRLQAERCDIKGGESLCLMLMHASHLTGLILDLHPANERRRYFVTTSLIGWVQPQNQLWSHMAHSRLDIFPDTMRSRYIAVIFLWITHERHSIAHP